MSSPATLCLSVSVSPSLSLSRSVCLSLSLSLLCAVCIVVVARSDCTNKTRLSFCFCYFVPISSYTGISLHPVSMIKSTRSPPPPTHPPHSLNLIVSPFHLFYALFFCLQFFFFFSISLILVSDLFLSPSSPIPHTDRVQRLDVSIRVRHELILCADQFRFSVALRPQKPLGLLGTGSPGCPPRLSHSS